jgi:hypothetical protein
MCRTELPPRPEKLIEKGASLFVSIMQREQLKGGSWGTSTAKEQKEIEGLLENGPRRLPSTPMPVFTGL